MDQDRLVYLIEKLQAATATVSELTELDSFYLEFEKKPGYIENLDDAQKENYKQLFFNRIQDKISNEEQIKVNNKTKVRHLLLRITAAASILFFLSFGLYFFLRKNVTQPLISKKHLNDIAPGSNGATLTLSNGQVIKLNSQANGKVALQGNMIVNKVGGQLIYTSLTGAAGASLENMVTTKRKEQYKVVLSDGTSVWLNAASSIKYPTAFVGKDREVTITGEAYFEVAHNARKPFKVFANGQTVEVLGTHFNINSYNDEASIKTTLIEGRVKVSKGDKTAFLSPGEQSKITNSGKNTQISVLSNADTEQAVSWKNGIFNFNDADIQTIMRQISRWYDVDIQYEGNIPQRQFAGKIHRNTNASNVLELLSYSRIHFKIENDIGREKIVVTP